MRRSALLGLAAVIYVVAAWAVSPGFYDGVSPSQPYNFVCPPTAPGADSGVKPSSGHLNIKVINGVSDANSAYTTDGQVIVGFLPGAFDVAGNSSVAVDITPVTPCPKPAGLHFATNSASSPLVKGASLVLLYSNVELDPSYVYYASDPNGPWTNIGSSEQAQFWTIQPASPVRGLGYFAAGYPSNVVSHNTSATNQLLPVVVAALILAVLLAGMPIALIRRRSLAGSVEDEPIREDHV